MSLINLSQKSLRNRLSSIVITTIAIALSVCLLLLIERVRVDARSSFHNTVSGTDLIVGARTGSTELLLFSVFRIGHPTNNLNWQSYRDITQDRSVKWAIPLSMGDSHKGFMVIGTNNHYFEHYRFANKQPLTFSEGRQFEQINEVVLGANVAKQLHYHLGDNLILSHGAGNTSFHHHDDHPFKVVGILMPTGTAVDNSVHVPLVAIDNIHGNSSTQAANTNSQHQTIASDDEHDDAHDHDNAHNHSDAHDYEDGHDHSNAHNHSNAHEHKDGHDHNNAHNHSDAHEHKDGHDHNNAHNHSNAHEHEDAHDQSQSDISQTHRPALSNAALTGEPKQISAFLLGLKNPIFALQLQRNINQYKSEPLLAIMPKFTLRQLWEVVGVFEKALMIISGAVVVIALLGMLTNLLASLSQRRRELAILRSVGASPRTIFALLGLESFLITTIAAVLAVAIYYLVIASLANLLGSISGIHLQLTLLSQYQLSLLAGIIALGTLLGCLPAYKAYRYALSDGLTIKV